jgi:hypothetical protein
MTQKKFKIGMKTFILPGQEYLAEEIYNNENYVVVDEDRVACPKEGIILLYLKYEDHSKED